MSYELIKNNTNANIPYSKMINERYWPIIFVAEDFSILDFVNRYKAIAENGSAINPTSGILRNSGNSSAIITTHPKNSFFDLFFISPHLIMFLLYPKSFLKC